MRDCEEVGSTIVTTRECASKIEIERWFAKGCERVLKRERECVYSINKNRVSVRERRCSMNERGVFVYYLE